MKRTLTILLFLLISVSAKSQLTKGNWLVGGTGSFSSSAFTNDYSSVTFNSKAINLSLSTNVGYFLMDKLAVGLLPRYNWSKSRVLNEGGGRSNTKQFEMGPFVRYYFLDAEKPMNILAEASYQYGKINLMPGKGSSNTVSFKAGPVVYFNSSVGLEFTVGYYSSTDNVLPSYRTKQNSFQTGIGFQIHLEK